MKVQLRNPLLDPGPSDAPAKTVDGSAAPYLDRLSVLVYTGEFESLDGPVEISETTLERLVESHNTRLERLSQQHDDIPSYAYPPIQLDHSVSSKDTVGRVMGRLFIDDYTLETGEVVKAVYGYPRFLGAENIACVQDGRWCHLSIGADLESGRLAELSVTPFPAAEYASLLSRRGPKSDNLSTNNQRKGQKMNREQLKKYLMEYENMSDEAAEKKLKAMDDEAMKDLAKKAKAKMQDGGDDDDKKDMSGKEDDDKKDMADGSDEKTEGNGDSKDDKKEKKEDDDDSDTVNIDLKNKNKKMGQGSGGSNVKRMAKNRLSSIKKSFADTLGEARLASRKTKILSRLSALKAEAKITPAEIKKLSIDDMAKKSDEVVDEVLKTYEAREPTVLVGMVGTTNADSLSEVHKKKRMSRLEYETRRNMSTLAHTVKDVPEPGDEPMTNGSAAAETAQVDTKEVETEYAALCKKIDDGDLDGLKARLSTFLKNVRLAGGEFDTRSNEDEIKRLSTSVESLEKQFNEVCGLADDLIDS
jgi:hypothetical protein